MSEVVAHARRGGRVLAICNGFQIACEAGLLPGALLRNANLQFVSQWVKLRVETAATDFTNRYQTGAILTIPVAHGEGRFTAPQEVLHQLEERNGIVFRYVDVAGQPSAEANPNGSMSNIAGIINESGNVLGMMPHPERAMEPLLGSSDGRALFESILAKVAA
jgi:phosphoribosylformylglycinamidine synthase